MVRVDVEWGGLVSDDGPFQGPIDLTSPNMGAWTAQPLPQYEPLPYTSPDANPWNWEAPPPAPAWSPTPGWGQAASPFGFGRDYSQIPTGFGPSLDQGFNWEAPAYDLPYQDFSAGPVQTEMPAPPWITPQGSPFDAANRAGQNAMDWWENVTPAALDIPLPFGANTIAKNAMAAGLEEPEPWYANAFGGQVGQGGGIGFNWDVTDNVLGPVLRSKPMEWANRGIQPVSSLLPEEVTGNPVTNFLGKQAVMALTPYGYLMEPTLELLSQSYKLPVAGPIIENTATPLNVGAAMLFGAPALGRAAAAEAGIGLPGLATRVAGRQIAQEFGATAGILGAQEVLNRTGIDNPYVSYGAGFLGGALGSGIGTMAANATMNAPTVLAATGRRPGRLQIPTEGATDIGPRMGEIKATGRMESAHPVDVDGAVIRKGDIVEVAGKRGVVHRSDYANENFTVRFDDGTKQTFNPGGISGKQYEEIRRIEPANPRFVPDPARPTYYKPAGQDSMLYHDIVEELGFPKGSPEYALARELDSQSATNYRQKVAGETHRRYDYELREVLGRILDDARAGLDVEPQDAIKALIDTGPQILVEGRRGLFDDLAESVLKDLAGPVPPRVQQQIDALNKVIGGNPDDVLPPHMLGTASKESLQAEELLVAAEKRAWREARSAQETADAITREANIQRTIRDVNASRVETPPESVSRTAADRAAGREGTRLTTAAKEADWAADPLVRLPMRLGAIEKELEKLRPQMVLRDPGARALARPRIQQLNQEAAKLRQQLADAAGKGGGKIPKVVGEAVPGGGGRKLPSGVRLVQEILAFPTALFSSNDLSYFMRQGVFGIGADPAAWADAVRKGLVDYEQSFGKIGRERILMRYEDTLADPIRGQLTKYSKDPGAYAHPLEASLDKADEMFASGVANKFPWVRASQASAATFINELRGALWENWYKSLEAVYGKGKIPEESLEKIAGAVLHFTGRGTGKKTQAAVNLLGNLAFPRFQASHLQRLGDTAWALRHYNDPAGSLVAKAAARYVFGVVGGLGIVKWLSREGLISDKIDVNFEDPTRADWGRLNINGITYDPWGGSQTWVRAFVQAGMNLGVDVPGANAGKEAPSGWDLLRSIGRGKLAPGASFVTDLLDENDYLGNRVNPKSKDPYLNFARDIGMGGAVGEIRRAAVEEGWIPAVLRGVEVLGLSTGGLWGGDEAYERREQEEKAAIAKARGYDPDTYLANPDEKRVVDREYWSRRSSTLAKDIVANIDERAGIESTYSTSIGTAEQRYNDILDQRNKLGRKAVLEPVDQKAATAAGLALREAYDKAQAERAAGLAAKPTGEPGEDEYWNTYQGYIKIIDQYKNEPRFMAEELQKFVFEQSPEWKARFRAEQALKMERLRKDHPALYQLEQDREFLGDNYWNRPPEQSAIDAVLANKKVEETLRKWGYSEPTLAVIDHRRESTAQQQADDDLFAKRQISPTDWKDRRSARNAADYAWESAIYRDATDTKGGNTVLDQWYDQIAMAKDAKTGVVNWDRVEAWEDALPPESKTELTALIDAKKSVWETETETKYRNLQNRLDQYGWYDINDNVYQAWAKAKYGERAPEILRWYPTQEAFEVALVQQAAASLISSGASEKEATARAWDIVSNAAGRKGNWGYAVEEYKKQWRQWFVNAHTKLAEDFYAFDMAGGAKEKERFFTALR